MIKVRNSTLASCGNKSHNFMNNYLFIQWKLPYYSRISSYWKSSFDKKCSRTLLNSVLIHTIV